MSSITRRGTVRDSAGDAILIAVVHSTIQSKIIGYSKLKRSELIQKLCPATVEPGGTVSQAVHEPASKSTEPHPAAPSSFHPTPVHSYAISSTPTLNDDTPSTAQNTLLATPTETLSPTFASDTSTSIGAHTPAIARPTSSPDPNANLLPFQLNYHGSSSETGYLYSTSSNSASIGEKRRLTAADAAVSLKDALQIQRERKRKATSTSQKGKTKVSPSPCSRDVSCHVVDVLRLSLQAVRLYSQNTENTSETTPAPKNALQLTNMTAVALNTPAEPSTRNDANVSDPSTHSQSTAVLRSFSTYDTSSSTAFQSASSHDFRPSAMSKVLTRAILPRNHDQTANSEHTGMTTGYSLAIPTPASNSALQAEENDSTSISKISTKNTSIKTAGAQMKTAIARASGKKATVHAFKPVRRVNPKMAPLKHSIIPADVDAIFQSSIATSATSFSLPRISSGTAALSTSEHIKIGRCKDIGDVKLGNIAKFAASTPNQHPGSSNLPKTILPSLSYEEPLLFTHNHSSDEVINARSTVRAELTVRMEKSWLYRFYQQIANARFDAMKQSRNASTGSRTPTGLPGMSAEFVCSAVTTSKQFDVAITFVIARIHTMIQGDDWIGLIKEEDVEDVTNVGGGIWEVSTRLRMLDIAARNIGGPSAFKSRKFIYTVIGETGEVIARSEGSDPQLRADWRSYIATVQTDATTSLLDYLKTKDDTSYPHGIAAGWSAKAKTDPKLEEEYRMARRYVLSNVMPNR